MSAASPRWRSRGSDVMAFGGRIRLGLANCLGSPSGSRLSGTEGAAAEAAPRAWGRGRQSRPPSGREDAERGPRGSAAPEGEAGGRVSTVTSHAGARPPSSGFSLFGCGSFTGLWVRGSELSRSHLGVRKEEAHAAVVREQRRGRRGRPPWARAARRAGRGRWSLARGALGPLSGRGGGWTPESPTRARGPPGRAHSARE